MKRSSALVVISCEVEESWNELMQKFAKNRFVVAWFILQLLVALAMFLFIAKQLEQREVYVDPRQFIMLYFFIMLVKSMSDFSSGTLSSKEMMLVYSQPVSPTSILVGKTGAILLFNMGLFAVGSGWMTLVMIMVPRLGFAVDPALYISMVVLTSLATFGGATFSIFTSLASKKKKFAYSVAYSQSLSLLFYILQYSPLSGAPLVLVLSLVTIANLAILLALGGMALEAWDFQTSTTPSPSIQKRIQHSPIIRRIASLMDEETGALFKKEIALDLKDRETAGMLISVSVMAASLLFVDYTIMHTEGTLGPFDKLRFIRPMIVGLGIFMSCTIGYSLKAASSISKEGKAVWLSKTLPVRPLSIMKSKAYSTLMFVPFTVVGIALPIPLYEYFGQWHALVFAALGTVTIAFAYTGFGLYMGAKFPSSSGSPDLVTLYNTTITTIVMGLALEGIPLQIMAKDPLVGIAASLCALGWGLVILNNGIHASARVFDRLEV